MQATSFAETPASTEVYGPPNYFKTIKTPFGTGSSQEKVDAVDQSDMSPIDLGNVHNSLSKRFNQSRFYLPSKMQLGRTCEFTVKGKPGSFVAIAMADKNKGAKPIYNHELRLGSDRKVVAIGQIDDSGVLNLYIETPIQGDLVGSCLYFEAAVWSNPDLSDFELATPIQSELIAKEPNGVLIAAEPDMKKGIRIVPQTRMNMQGNTNVDTGFQTGKP